MKKCNFQSFHESRSEIDSSWVTIGQMIDIWIKGRLRETILKSADAAHVIASPK